MKLTNIQILFIGVFALFTGISVIILLFMTIMRGPEIPWPMLFVGGMLPPMWFITNRLQKDLEETRK